MMRKITIGGIKFDLVKYSPATRKKHEHDFDRALFEHADAPQWFCALVSRHVLGRRVGIGWCLSKHSRANDSKIIETIPLGRTLREAWTRLNLMRNF